MLIPFNTICEKYNLKIRGILHLGAHLLEEKEDYESKNVNLTFIILYSDYLICFFHSKFNFKYLFFFIAFIHFIKTIDYFIYL